MGIHIYGNDPNQTLTVASGDISGNLVVFGKGAGDNVEAENGNIIQNILGFGNGGGDNVEAQNVTQNVITFGNGYGDFVDAGNANQDVIVFGNGGSDSVDFGKLSNSSITFHDIASGVNDGVVTIGTISNSKITLGNGDADSAGSFVGGNNNTFTFGNGNDDNADIGHLAIAGVGGSNNTFTFGNGAGDFVDIFGPSSNNKITLGNGQGDSVGLGKMSTTDVTSPGGDYVATGTGASDIVTVGAHADADTFAFALGTTGVNFTTVFAAAAGDHVVVNGGQLGNTLLSGSTVDLSLADYIGSLGTLTKGDTYVGFNTSVHETFIVTDTASGHTGAIEITGAFQTSTLANHVLTLHA
jgi:hypothetical protein